MDSLKVKIPSIFVVSRSFYLFFFFSSQNLSSHYQGTNYREQSSIKTHLIHERGPQPKSDPDPLVYIPHTSESYNRRDLTIVDLILN